MAADPAAHLFAVKLEIAAPAVVGQIVALPAWIPGSYMIREFARHIVQIRGESNGRTIALKKRNKHSWQAAPCDGPLTLQYQVYAWALSVRAPHLDQTHGFLMALACLYMLWAKKMRRKWWISPSARR